MLLSFAALYGLIAGSFVNAYVWRTHMGVKGKNRSGSSSLISSSILRGRSVCTKCRHQLAAKDLVPVLSWLWLKGRCRYCRQPISWQEPVVEVGTAVIFVLSIIWWPRELVSVLALAQLLVWLGITTLFLALSVYDIRWYLLPDRMVLVLLGLIVSFQILLAFSGAAVTEWLLQPLLGAIGAFLFFYLLYLLGRGKWMGGGDVKLVFVLGLLVGGIGTVAGLFISFITAALVGTVLIIMGRKGRRDVVPFGPFLLAGFWLAWFFGEHLAAWYVDLITIGPY